jgi:uncharacterized protein (DUF697 family)
VSVYETSETTEFEQPEMEFGPAGETSEYGSEFETAETEAEAEGFLGGLLSSVLGGEAAEAESPLSEMQEMELATELLEVSSEAELEQFLGGLFKKVASGVGSFMKSGTGRALGGILKNVAKKALPVVGGALGSFVAPGVGTALGSKLGSMASNLFEVELETMSEQEAEFEVARRYVRLASSAARNAALAPRNAPPRAVARAAVVSAARRHAPGLVRGTPYQVPRRPSRPGRPVQRPGGTQPQPGRPRPRPRPYGAPAPSPGYADAGPAWGVYGDEPSWADGDDGGVWYDGDDGGAPSARHARPQSGRWVRRGRKIVILGA